MAIIRGRVYHDRELVNMVGNFGGPSPFEKCECGKWRNKKTKEHAVSLTLSEFMALNKPAPCVDKQNLEPQESGEKE